MCVPTYFGTTSVAEKQATTQRSWEDTHANHAPDDPLLGCLILLTQLRHQPHTADSLLAGLPVQPGGLTPDLFIRAAARVNLSARLVKKPLNKISQLVLPVVLLLKNGQACVLVERVDDQVKVLFPESGDGEQQLPVSKLSAEYTGLALFVQQTHRFDARTDGLTQEPGKHWFWGTIARSWTLYTDVLVAAFLINLFALASPLFIMNVYDRVVPNEAMETLWVLASGVAIVYVFDFILRMMRGYFIDVASKKSDILISSQIFSKVMGLRSEARPASVGAFANNLHEFEGFRDFFTSATLTAIIDLPFVVLFLLVIWFIGGPLALVPALTIPIVLLYGLMIQNPLRLAVNHTFQKSAQKNATLIESLSGIETVKTMRAESLLQRRWEDAVGYVAKWGIKSRFLSQSATHVAVFMQQLATVVLVIYGVYLIADGDLTTGALIACVILTGRALAPMAQIAALLTRYHHSATAYQSLSKIMQLPEERPAGKKFLHRPAFEGGIEFKDVSFRYPNQSVNALSHVSFRIQPGERVAIIGRMGSGKTTLEKLILGLYEPTDGAVLVDNIDIRQLDPADVRRNIGYTPQDGTLFYGTVKDNIVLSAPYADDAAILRATALSGVDEFTQQHPQGLDMPVGEQGVGLSGGQRQTVAIARSLLLDPPILLMDEPSNSLDNSTEDRLKKRLSPYLDKKTLILITHRASLLEWVSRVIVMDGGKIIADGPKAQVLDALKQGRLKTVGAS